jgi:hypothetical protein
LVSAVEVARRRLLLLRRWTGRFLPVVCLEVEDMQRGYHRTLSDQPSTLGGFESGVGKGVEVLTKRYIFDPTTVVEAP